MIPKLKIVPVSKIVPVMKFSQKKVEYIKEIIEASGNICTPVSLIELPDKEFLLLDDCSILKAAKDLDIKYLPAQLTSENQILDISAEILVENFRPDLMDEFVSYFPRVAVVCSNKKELKHHNDDLKATFSKKKEKDIIICFRSYNSEMLPGSIFDFLDFLSHRCRLARKTYAKNIRTANTKPKQNDWLLKFDNLNFEYIKAAADLKRYFPSGLLRFDYHCRVIGIEYPVNVLNEKVSTREKERFLYDLVNFRMNNEQSEYIEGGVYLLNYLVRK